MWAISSKGLHSGNGPFPDDAVYVDEETYAGLYENLDVINISVVNGQIHVTADLVGIKRVAISKVKLQNFTVHQGIHVFDYELALVQQLSSLDSPIYVHGGLFAGTCESLARSIHERNKLYHSTVDRINSATTPDAVTEALEAFLKWQTN